MQCSGKSASGYQTRDQRSQATFHFISQQKVQKQYGSLQGSVWRKEVWLHCENENKREGGSCEVEKQEHKKNIAKGLSYKAPYIILSYFAWNELKARSTLLVFVVKNGGASSLESVPNSYT